MNGPTDDREINLNDYDEFMVADYAPLDKPYVLTIAGACLAKSYDRKADQEIEVPALKFKESRKKLKLTSNDNRHALGRLYGPKASGWTGKQISVRVVEKKIFGKMTRYFVIDNFVPKAESAPAPKPAAVKSPFDQLWDLAAIHEEPKQVVEDLLRETGGDAVAALEALKQKHAQAAS